RRRRDDDLLRARAEVRHCRLALREEPGRLERDVDPEVAPGQLLRVTVREHLQLAVADSDRPLADLDVLVERAEDGVVLQQVPHRLRVAEVVDGHDLEVRTPLEGCAEEVATDTAEAVDSYSQRHSSPRVVCERESNRRVGRGGPEGKLRGRPPPPV